MRLVLKAIGGLLFFATVSVLLTACEPDKPGPMREWRCLYGWEEEAVSFTAISRKNPESATVRDTEGFSRKPRNEYGRLVHSCVSRPLPH